MKGIKPRRFVTGLHQKTHVFGFLSEDKKRMFAFNEKMNAQIFLKVLCQARLKFKKIILILDRAPWHRANKVKEYLKKYNHEIKVIWFPKGCPEMNPVEECWRQAKKEVNGGRIHKNFEVMKRELKHFLRYKNFKQDMVKYLRP